MFKSGILFKTRKMPRSHSSSSKPSSPVLNQAPKFHSPIGPIMSSSNMNQTQSSSPGFFTSVKEGVGLGAGSAIGHRIVASIFGPPSVEVKTSTPPGSNSGTPTVYGSTAGKPCEVIQNSFNTCIQERKPVEECEQTLTLLNKCLNGSSS